MIITNEKLKKLIEPHFYESLKEDNYVINSIKANKLLTYNRFDIAFKLIYLEMLEYNVSFSENIYKEHIKAFSLGKFTEPGNESKNTFDKFIEEFKNTFEDIKKNGFNNSKTLIALSKSETIVNGSHRIASSIYLDKSIDCIQMNIDEHIYDYNFFYKRNVPKEMLDKVATKFVEYAQNIHIAFIWPSAIGNDEKIEEIIPNIVYRKNIKLNPNGAHNLLSQIYYEEDWLGDTKNNFKGVNGKLVECFKTFDSIKIIAFQATNLDEVLNIKEQIRKVFNIGKHSIHISDTKEEAIQVARIVFNQNSIHFLNYAKPNKYTSSFAKIDNFKNFIKDNKMKFSDFLLDSSMTLSIYGLREAKDIDYFYNGGDIIQEYDNINIHDEVLCYHEEEKVDLLYNQNFYFYFNNIKFISFSQLYKMKKNRNETKDKNDCAMMKNFLENNIIKKNIYAVLQNMFYLKVKFLSIMMNTLRYLGIYNSIKKLYYFIKGKK